VLLAVRCRECGVSRCIEVYRVCNTAGVPAKQDTSNKMKQKRETWFQQKTSSEPPRRAFAGSAPPDATFECPSPDTIQSI